MPITIHFKYPHPEGTIKTGASLLPFWDASSGAEVGIGAEATTWRVACGLLMTACKMGDHIVTPDPKAANCPICKKTKAYADAMAAREVQIERIPVEMADAAKPAVGEGRPERPVDHAGARKPK